MAAQVYKLSVAIELPQITIEGEFFEFNYIFKNIGKNNFPGGQITVKMWWPNLGEIVKVIHRVNIPALNPGKEYKSDMFKDRPLVAGYTIFSPAADVYIASDGKFIELYLEDGKTLSHRRPIDSVRSQSHEEINQKEDLRIARKSMNIAIIALIILIVVEVGKLLIEIF